MAVADQTEIPDEAMEAARDAAQDAHGRCNPYLGCCGVSGIEEAVAAAAPFLTAPKDAEIAALHAEIARLTAGAGNSPIQEIAFLSPGQWIAHWNSLSAEQRLEQAARVIEVSQQAHACFSGDHVGRIKHLTQLHDDRDVIERQRAAAVRGEHRDTDTTPEDDPDHCPGELAFDGQHTADYRKRGWVCVWCSADPDETAATSTPEGCQS